MTADEMLRELERAPRAGVNRVLKQLGVTKDEREGVREAIRRGEMRLEPKPAPAASPPVEVEVQQQPAPQVTMAPPPVALASESDFQALAMFESLPAGNWNRDRIAAEYGDAIARARAAREAQNRAAQIAMQEHVRTVAANPQQLYETYRGYVDRGEKHKAALVRQAHNSTLAAYEESLRRAAAAQEGERVVAALQSELSPAQQEIVATYQRLERDGKPIAAAGIRALHPQLFERATAIAAAAKKGK
jgi:hypothetical protein